ncbi:hypothetical protein RJ53_09020 [Methanocalculus chunghsingensis]|uniref:Uncharacterized protein n=1 Tax=Methanocalculus chunghsingensis TaxID=156457 RepID=A0A8J7WAH4_9EURY|nr:hypothetical protein [Methanocalculus chunghsingensis]MBR1369615.1 hypothetical protein [Methanocalculus chunghsingensis]
MNEQIGKKEIPHKTRSCIRNHPIAAIASAFGAGAVIGLMIGGGGRTRTGTGQKGGGLLSWTFARATPLVISYMTSLIMPYLFFLLFRRKRG